MIINGEQTGNLVNKVSFTQKNIKDRDTNRQTQNYKQNQKSYSESAKEERQLLFECTTLEQSPQ